MRTEQEISDARKAFRDYPAMSRDHADECGIAASVLSWVLGEETVYSEAIGRLIERYTERLKEEPQETP